MNNLKEIAPYLNLLPIGLVFIMWTKFDKVWDAIDGKTAKKHADETFQRKDLCEQTVNSLAKNVSEIKEDVKTLLKR